MNRLAGKVERAAIVGLVLLFACGKGGRLGQAGGTPTGDGGSGAINGSATPSAASGAAKKTYSAHGVTFEYPATWQPLTITGSNASTGGTAVWQAALGPSPGADFVSVTDYTLTAAVTTANLDQQASSLSDRIRSLFEQADGSMTSGPDKLEVGGLPALEFDGTGKTADGIDIVTRLVLAYQGTTEYLISCQSTSGHGEEIGHGCDDVVQSFAVQGG